MEKKKATLMFLLQFFTAHVLAVCVLGGGYYFLPALLPLPESNDFTAKLMFTLRCCVFPQALLLFFTIFRVANKRGSTPAGNPLSGQDQNYLQAEKNALTNTMEQLVLFNLLLLVLLTYLEPAEMKIVPLLSLYFIAARLLFIIGYSIVPLYRVLGIIMNFDLTFFFVGCIAYLMYSRGFMYNIPFSNGGSGDGATTRTEL